jgi:iron complex outermembrane receptor protein
MNFNSIFKAILSVSPIFLLAGFISTCAAQQTVHGTITDTQTGDPLAGANIIQIHTQNGTSSDENGQFSLSLIKEKPAKIRISYIGYETKVIQTGNKKGSLKIKLQPVILTTNAIFVQGVRAGKSTPIASETMKRAKINKKNMGQSFTWLLKNLPSVTTTSDAGAGIGYTHMHIRGVDPTRINVTINGIPVNDAESQGVFWVDIPGLASSIQSIQIQRGVGTSTNGAGAFGASVNIQTVKMRDKPFGEINVGGGSFATRRATVKLGSGLIGNGWQVQGRLSRLYSDGYRDRAFSNLRSFFLSAAHHGKHGLLRADVFSGKEKTYQAWTGITRKRLRTDRTYNPLGTSRPGHPYKNQTDNYQQDHYQLHYSHQFSDALEANAALFFVYGRGYYQNYYANQKLTDFGLKPVELLDTIITRSDLINQDWLKNYFYGGVFTIHYNHNDLDLKIGGAYDQYRGKHYKQVVKSMISNFLGKAHRYNYNTAFKTDGNLYGKLNYFFTDALSGYLDLQMRHIYYRFLGKDQQPAPGGGFRIVDVTQSVPLMFFNPKVGLMYRFAGRQRIYASFGVGNKEPDRDDYVDSTPKTRPKPESLYDWELGYKAQYQRFSGGINLYYMDYKDQLIPTGEINDVGAVILQNTPHSYRAGIELQTGVQILPQLRWLGNATFSRNKIRNYTQYLNNLDTGKQSARTYKHTTIAFSPGFIGNSIFNFNDHGFSATYTSKYVSRQYLDNTQTKSRSIDPYFVNDLQLAYEFGSLAFAKNIKISLLINNIFNEKYVNNGAAYGNISDGEIHYTSYFYPQAGRNYLGRVTIDF